MVSFMLLYFTTIIFFKYYFSREVSELILWTAETGHTLICITM